MVKSPLLLIADDNIAYKRPKQIQKDAERRARFLARKDAEALIPAYNDDANAAIFNDGLGLNEEKLHYLLNLGPDFDTDFRDEVTGPAGPTVFDSAIDNPVEPVDDLVKLVDDLIEPVDNLIGPIE